MRDRLHKAAGLLGGIIAIVTAIAAVSWYLYQEQERLVGVAGLLAVEILIATLRWWVVSDRESS